MKTIIDGASKPKQKILKQLCTNLFSENKSYFDSLELAIQEKAQETARANIQAIAVWFKSNVKYLRAQNLFSEGNDHAFLKSLEGFHRKGSSILQQDPHMNAHILKKSLAFLDNKPKALGEFPELESLLRALLREGISHTYLRDVLSNAKELIAAIINEERVIA